MINREELSISLHNILGTNNVYFNPPKTVNINYPAIIYFRNDIQNTQANNKVYKQDVVYTITVVDFNPDSEIVKRVSQLPLCRYIRHYKADGLNHDVFELYN